MTATTTLYVAGPMTGYPKFNYPEFVKVAQLLQDRGYTTLNPTESSVPANSPWETYMRATLTMMLKADGVAVLSGWECSRGARIEVELALSLGMPVRPYNQWLGRWAP